MLVLSNGNRVVVEWVQHEILEAPIHVYNFEVEDFHTYFVGECGVLVHNECKSYAKLRAELKENGDTRQAHHVSQDAAFGDVIPHSEGIAVPLEGNIFKDKSSPHYKAHQTMEEFWDDYRKGGKYRDRTPTVGQYNEAAKKSLINAGMSQKDAEAVMEEVVKQQEKYKLFSNSPVPRVPGKIRNVKY